MVRIRRKIRQYRMDENPHYAELAKVPTYKLRQVMNYLMLNEYLAVTNDEYAVVKLTGKSKLILEEDETVTMKMAKEQEHPAKAAGEKKGKKSREQRPLNWMKRMRSCLRFCGACERNWRKKKGCLRILCSRINRWYICVIRPVNRNEMLSVSGVGEFKYEKYGEVFLEKVIEFNREHGEDG